MKKICLLLAILSTCLLNVSIAHATNYCTNGELGGGWLFDETSGNAVDCTSNANNGTLTSVTQGITGHFNLAYSYPGIERNYVDVPAATSINTLPTLSMGAWVNPTSAGNAGSGLCTGANIFSKSGTSGAQQLELCITNTGGIVFTAKWTGSGLVSWQTTSSPVTTGSWQHIVVTYSFSSTANSPIVYYNNVAQTVSTFETPAGSQTSDSSNDLSIGNENLGSGNGGWNGGIDEAFYANIVLSSTDVANIYNHGLNGGFNNTTTSVLNSAVINNATNI